MILKLFLVLVPAAVLAYQPIRIQVEVSKDLFGAEVEVSGEFRRTITDEELRAFGITDTVIGNAVQQITNVQPKEILLKNSPTSPGIVYQNNGWEEVSIELEPESGTVLGVQSKPVVLASKQVTNNKTQSETVDAGLWYVVPHSLTASWGNFAVSGSPIPIEYKVKIENANLRLYFGLPWGQNIKDLPPADIKDRYGRPNTLVSLGPGETVQADLVAKEVVVDLKVDYAVDFEGDVVCLIAGGIQGESFLKLDIESVLEKGNLPKKVILSELVQVTVYTDVQMLVTRGNPYAG